MAGYFDEGYYLKSKLAQLQKAGEKDADGNDYDATTLLQAIHDAGMTPESHYEIHGRTEKLNPNAYFNEVEYLEAKLEQVLSVGETDSNGNPYTLPTLIAAIEAAGMTAIEHYEKFGGKEMDAEGNLINPSNAFDANAYATAKLAELMKVEPEKWAGKTAKDVVEAIAEAGMTPVSHYDQYGAAEAAAAKIALVQTVPVVARVANDPARAEVTGENVPSNYNAPTPPPATVAAENATPVTKPADMGAKVPADVSPAVTVPSKPVLVEGDTGYKAPPANLVDTNEKPVVPPTTDNGSVTDNWITVNPDGSGTITTPDGKPGGTLDKGTITPDGDGGIVISPDAKPIPPVDPTPDPTPDPVDPPSPPTPPTPETVTVTHPGKEVSEYNAGTEAADVITGLNGADYLRGNGGNDIIFAGASTTRLSGLFNESKDTLTDESSTSVLFGGGSNGPFNASSDKSLKIMDKSNILEGRAGNDTLVASDQQDTFFYQITTNTGQAGESLSGVDGVGADTIHQFKVGQDKLFITDLIDSHIIGTGTQDAHVGEGVHGWKNLTDNVTLVKNGVDATLTIDKAFFKTDGSTDDNAPANLVINFKNMQGIDQITDAGSDGIKGADLKALFYEAGETKTGDESANTIIGTSGNDYIKGAGAADTLAGANGADWLSGGAGNDTIYGGAKAGEANAQYKASADSSTPLTTNATFMNLMNGKTTNEAGYLSDNAFKTLNNANILEGRGGDDNLMASSAKDVFLYQTGGTATGEGVPARDDELTFKELGADTIYGFALGKDKLFIMDQDSWNMNATTADTFGTRGFSTAWDFKAMTADAATAKVAVKGAHDAVSTDLDYGFGTAAYTDATANTNELYIQTGANKTIITISSEVLAVSQKTGETDDTLTITLAGVKSDDLTSANAEVFFESLFGVSA